MDITGVALVYLRLLFKLLYTSHIIVHLDGFVATTFATFAPLFTPSAIGSLSLPILSSGVPGNVVFDIFNSCVGKSIGGEEVYKPHTWTCMERGCLEDWAMDIMILFNWRRFASETGPRTWEKPSLKETANWFDWLGERATF